MALNSFPHFLAPGGFGGLSGLKNVPTFCLPCIAMRAQYICGRCPYWHASIPPQDRPHVACCLSLRLPPTVFGFTIRSFKRQRPSTPPLCRRSPGNPEALGHYACTTNDTAVVFTSWRRARGTDSRHALFRSHWRGQHAMRFAGKFEPFAGNLT